MLCAAGGLEIAESDRVGAKSVAGIYNVIGTANLNGSDPRELPSKTSVTHRRTSEVFGLAVVRCACSSDPST